MTSRFAPGARVLPGVLLLFAVAGFGPCAHHASGPNGTYVAATITTCWPNDDGRWWNYAVVSRPLVHGPVPGYTDRASVPAVTIDSALVRLGLPADTSGTAPTAYAYRLEFAGSLQTESGVVTQRLVESFPTSVLAAPSWSARLLARIAEVRPDLRERLPRAAVLAAANGTSVQNVPVFIHDYSWIRTPTWVGGYGDADTLPAWRYLENDLRPGHGFQFRLVPSLASDIWLLGRVHRVVTAAVPGGTVSNAIEVVYVIDYGVLAIASPNGGPTTYARPFDFGRVVYAPGSGPVEVAEYRVAHVGGGPQDHGMQMLALAVAATGKDAVTALAR